VECRMSSVGLKVGAAEMVPAQLVGNDEEDVHRPATLAADGGMDDGDAPRDYPLGDGSPALRRRRGGQYAFTGGVRMRPLTGAPFFSLWRLGTAWR
jgi:hypothetical protein